MPFTTPRTWSDGYMVTASDLNSEIRDNVTALAPGHQVLTTTQKNALTGVTTGTMVYDSTLGQSQVYTGTAWVNTPVAATVPSVQVARSTNYSTYASAQDIPWETATWDTAAMFPSAGTTVTIPYSGLYQLTLWVGLTSGTAFTTCYPTLRKNTTDLNLETRYVNSTIAYLNVCLVESLAAGDTISGRVTFTGGTGGSTNTVYGAAASIPSARSRMSVTWIGKAA